MEPSPQLARTFFVWVGVFVGVLAPGSLATAESLDRTGTQWAPYVEWALENPTWEGNPFDLVATVTFTHPSGEVRRTEMFYDGNNTWKFRFTATRTGTWELTTSSDDPELDGKHGTITIRPNPNPTIDGFITAYGNRWARTGSGRVFVPQLVMYKEAVQFYDRPEMIDADIATFLVGHGFNGFHVIGSCHWFDITKKRSDEIDVPNPDPRTFEALELLITKAHAAGGMVHLWMWGDEQRRWTPIRWGINGPEDRRLQRYIAARLGPLPGWTMGYGFDLQEWVKEDDLRDWHQYMQAHFGWPHLLGGRWPGLDQRYEGLDYAGYEQHRPDYAMYVETIERRPDKPAFSEDRFRIRDPSPYPQKDYDEEMTRRGLWHSTMAGGVANIWGYLPRGRDGALGSAPYPHSEWIRTYATFFRGRFLRDMVRDNAITDGLSLRTPDRTRYVFYREDATRIVLDLSAMPDETAAVAVDAKEPYAEIDIGPLLPVKQTWTAPYRSDWAVAVGTFDR